MFWNKKKKGAKQKKSSEGDAPPQKPMSREDIIAQAQANAAAAREEIGDETLEKIREAMLKKENNPFEQAKNKVKSMDREKVADSVRDWMREKD